MKNGCREEEVIVHPVGGMQLAEGVIRETGAKRFVGNLPGIAPVIGDTIDEVLMRLDRKAKTYYGDDVVVELASRIAAA